MDVQRISHVLDEMSVKCNKQVTSKQQIRFYLTSINSSSKTTVVFGTAMTILEIGISFPTACRFEFVKDHEMMQKCIWSSYAKEFGSC